MDNSLKILIIDDFATMRKILSTFLVKLGFSNITEADDAKKAWEILQTETFDLVISDFNMPEMNGLELLRKIRLESNNKDQKFIMLTAETDKELLMDTKTLKVDSYILKPFKIEVIEEKIKAIFP
jgi:two-component system chemotaxis response regulator CheY